jgi:hypothetical protein
MIPDTTLVIVWLVFAHLAADFVLQNDWIALNKGNGTPEGNKALLTHGFHVGLCLLPAVFAFGLPGLVYLVLVVVSHLLVDRWKVQATRRAEAAAQEAAVLRMERTGEIPPSGLGGAWTPWPGMLFLADQALHMTFAIVGWLVVLAGVPLTAAWVDFVNLVLRDWNRTTVNAVILTGVVLVSLFLVNTRGAYYFVLALVSPRDVRRVGEAMQAAAAAPAAATQTAPAGYTVRVGPLVATVEPSVAAAGGPANAEAKDATTAAEEGAIAVGAGPAEAAGSDPFAKPMTPAVPVGAPARIGATIGALERILIVTFILTGTAAAVGVVIAVKTLARFKQLDDRGFAEYYLLGTLASVSVAIGSAYLALAAFASLR